MVLTIQHQNSFSNALYRLRRVSRFNIDCFINIIPLTIHIIENVRCTIGIEEVETYTRYFIFRSYAIFIRPILGIRIGGAGLTSITCWSIANSL